ncbi:hypothetical protein [Halapricum salinum]|nr:hypothetical protein [Halapricum salinum]
MPTTQIRAHGDRNVLPEGTSPSVDTRECPIDEFTLSHMRSTRTDE